MTVELYSPGRKAPAGAQLTYRGGPLLQQAELFGVFIDDPSTGQPHPLMSQLSTYLDFETGSDLASLLAEYNVQGPINHVGDASLSLSGSAPPPPPPPVPGPPPPTDCMALLNEWLTCIGFAQTHKLKHHKHSSLGLPHRIRLAGTVVPDSDLQTLLANAIAKGSLPKPNTSMLFVMYLPDGATVQLGQDASCQTFCGYHSNFSLSDGTAVYYAILPYPSCSGCLGGMSVINSLTTISRHELAEAITDAVPGSGWYDDTNGEIGDICAWQEKTIGSTTVQLLWSNKANSCV